MLPSGNGGPACRAWIADARGPELVRGRTRRHGVATRGSSTRRVGQFSQAEVRLFWRALENVKSCPVRCCGGFMFSCFPVFLTRDTTVYSMPRIVLQHAASDQPHGFARAPLKNSIRETSKQIRLRAN